MIITYLRSSSYNRYDFCPHAFYIEYNLGIRPPGNKKADKGTIVHKILEVLALAKKNFQEGKKSFTHDICGRVIFGTANVDKIVDQVYNYYAHRMDQDWEEQDLIDIRKWTYKAINYRGGKFDPRNLLIVEAEANFDFNLVAPWATFSYNVCGQEISGFCALKGTIDLVTQVSPEIYEITDYKTGRRWDWAKNQEKTPASLCNDPQLRLYHYAASHIYPEVDQIIVTIFFINDGGPFSVCFSKEDLATTEALIRKRFEEIRDCIKPQLKRSWKCTRLCHFGKTTFENTHIDPIHEFRQGQVCPVGSIMTKCEQVRYMLDTQGITETTAQYKVPSHDINYYHDPGDTS